MWTVDCCFSCSGGDVWALDGRFSFGGEDTSVAVSRPKGTFLLRPHVCSPLGLGDSGRVESCLLV